MNEICARLHLLLRELKTHRFPYKVEHIPSNGIYVLFEKGETGHNGKRIVRIGTHTGDGNLRSRLKEHFLVANKDRSIFRKNIGRALLNRDKDPFLAQWEFDLTTRAAKRKIAPLVDYLKQDEVEQEVSAYIRDQFEFVVISEPEKASRIVLEARIISTVSLCTDCAASQDWLGSSSTKDKIRISGLWQVNGLYGTGLSPSDLVSFSSKLVHQ